MLRYGRYSSNSWTIRLLKLGMVFKSSWPDAVLTFSFLPGVFVATVAGPAGEAAGELAGVAELVVAVWLPLQAPKQMVDRTRAASDTDRDTSRSIFFPSKESD